MTDRDPGESFDCYCGEELTVPAEKERVDSTRNAAARAAGERAKRLRAAGVAGLVAFVLGMALLAVATYVALVRGTLSTAACALLLGLGFLAAAAFANAERRSILREDDDDAAD